MLRMVQCAGDLIGGASMSASTLQEDGETKSPPIRMLARLSALEAIIDDRSARKQSSWQEMKAAIAEVREMLENSPEPEPGDAGSADQPTGEIDKPIEDLLEGLERRLASAPDASG
jgi:hypothetical protein